MNPMNMKKLVVSVVALGAATSAVVFGSMAAWTATSQNPGNSVTTGELKLTNDKDGLAVITATGVKPGDTGSSTVKITNGGSTSLAVKLSQTNVVQGASDSLKFRIHDGTNCIYPAKTGACDAYGLWNATALNNLDVGTLAAAGTKTYTVSYILETGSPNTDQNKVSTFGLKWDGTVGV